MKPCTTIRALAACKALPFGLSGTLGRLTIAAVCGVGLAAGAAAQNFPAVSAGGCPYVSSPRDVTMEIVEIRYVDSVPGVDGNSMRIPSEHSAKFRVAVVTVKVRKPIGKRLTLAAADLTLHYNHGASQEVAPCEGMSGFSRKIDDERGIKLFRGQGPGWIKQSTGIRLTDLSEVYFDAVFSLIEPQIREVWLYVAQPAMSKPFTTNGWNP